jgi:predicted permease
VLALSVATPAPLTDARRAVFYDRLLEEVRGVAGVASAGVSSELFVGGVGEQTVVAEGSGSGPVRLALRRDEIAGDFFATVDTPMLRGRTFTAADGPAAPRVAIVNEAMASRVWGSVDPIGRRFTLDRPAAGAVWFTVVGVTGDMRRQGLETAPPPQMFEPLAQNPSRRAILFVRSIGDDPRPLAGPLRDAVRRTEPQALVYGVTTVADRMRAMLAQRRLQTQLIALFSAAALLLAGLGLYGLIQYSVAMRSQEIGVRMALGATAADIFRMIFREGFALSLAGLGVGLLGALWLTRAWSSLLFGVSATDRFTFAGVSVLLLAAAAAACWLPARRAMRLPAGFRL